MYTLGIDLHKKSSVWVLIDEQRTELWKDNVLCHPKYINIAVEKIPVPHTEIQVAIEPVRFDKRTRGPAEIKKCESPVRSIY